jgi:hypothetical protein
MRKNEYLEFYKELNDDKSLEKHDRLYDKLKQLWIDGQNDDILELMGLFNHKEVNRGLLRTMLITLKPIRKIDDRIDQMFTNLADILRSGSKNGII